MNTINILNRATAMPNCEAVPSVDAAPKFVAMSNVDTAPSFKAAAPTFDAASHPQTVSLRGSRYALSTVAVGTVASPAFATLVGTDGRTRDAKQAAPPRGKYC